MRFEPVQYSASAVQPLPREPLPSILERAPAPSASAGCSSALRTIEVASAGLSALRVSLVGPMGDDFERALTLICEARGRVVVTGMGKSGHIGAKIAATLASTGTPAFFVHPAEASHGDLGMITRDDVVLALSWSGETAELKNIVAFSHRLRIPLVAITSRPQSTLATSADVALILPRVEDIGAAGLAPTTSTLIQLALGDALAIALLDRGGFTADDFYRFHPGGALGANLTRVADIMRRGDAMPLAPLGTRMIDALLTITGHGVGCLGIVDARGCIVGIITDGDLRRHLSPGILEKRVDDVMTRDPKWIEPDTLAVSAIDILNRNAITALFIVENEQPLGVVHLHDLLRFGAQ